MCSAAERTRITKANIAKIKTNDLKKYIKQQLSAGEIGYIYDVPCYSIRKIATKLGLANDLAVNGKAKKIEHCRSIGNKMREGNYIPKDTYRTDELIDDLKCNMQERIGRKKWSYGKVKL